MSRAALEVQHASPQTTDDGEENASSSCSSAIITHIPGVAALSNPEENGGQERNLARDAERRQ